MCLFSALIAFVSITAIKFIEIVLKAFKIILQRDIPKSPHLLTYSLIYSIFRKCHTLNGPIDNVIVNFRIGI